MTKLYIKSFLNKFLILVTFIVVSNKIYADTYKYRIFQSYQTPNDTIQIFIDNNSPTFENLTKCEFVLSNQVKNGHEKIKNYRMPDLSNYKQDIIIDADGDVKKIYFLKNKFGKIQSQWGCLRLKDIKTKTVSVDFKKVITNEFKKDKKCIVILSSVLDLIRGQVNFEMKELYKVKFPNFYLKLDDKKLLKNTLIEIRKIYLKYSSPSGYFPSKEINQMKVEEINNLLKNGENFLSNQLLKCKDNT